MQNWLNTYKQLKVISGHFCFRRMGQRLFTLAINIVRQNLDFSCRLFIKIDCHTLLKVSADFTAIDPRSLYVSVMQEIPARFALDLYNSLTRQLVQRTLNPRRHGGLKKFLTVQEKPNPVAPSPSVLSPFTQPVIIQKTSQPNRFIVSSEMSRCPCRVDFRGKKYHNYYE